MQCDCSVQRPDTTGINLISFRKSDAQAGIDAGIKAARAAIPEIKRKLAAIVVTTADDNTGQQ